jgi:hypothetical protein
MIKVTVDSRAVKAALAAYPKIASRSLEIAIDKTAMAIKEAEVAEMKRVFTKPTPYTLNSLKVTRTKGHNMKATVWFKEPDRMEDHYLIPEVEGGERKLKGFERAISNNKFVPGKGSSKDRYGNVPNSQIRQILGVLGKAERAGYQANITARSTKRNRKQRDYVFLPAGSPGRKLPPGIYQRVVQKGSGFFGDKSQKKLGSFGTYQKGRRRGRFFSVIRARGLKPILIVGRQHGQYQARLKFYHVARRVHGEVFTKLFMADFSRRLTS